MASEHISRERWGKDHWSTLAYLGTCAMDGRPFKPEKMRCNPATHLGYLARVQVGFLPDAKPEWKPTWGTILADGRLDDHDDYDVCDDLEREGLAEFFSYANGTFTLTDAGLDMVREITRHKMRDGKFRNFRPVPREQG